MQPFSYAKVTSRDAAIATVEQDETAAFIAGGTDLLGLMKDGVQTANILIDINNLPLADIVSLTNGIRIGAISRMSDVAFHPKIQQCYPVISQALLQSASPQLRNMATVGGNLLQRVRCGYFRDPVFPCNKRTPGLGCAAITGYNRMHAIFGASEHCIAVHPSDLAVALTALDAIIYIQGVEKERQISIHDFYLLPGDTPEKETVLQPGELIIAIEVPNSVYKSYYLKVRDRASYQFALVSVAIVVELEQDIIQSARIAFGGVAPKPWRARDAEEFLKGKAINEATFKAAGEAAVKEAEPQTHNEFKIELVKGALVRALSVVTEKL
ncbi:MULTISPECIES: FAD binding domain-containing protein [unclassified Tolypothrix]|uniref:FAD binding domain-containing protein n=1 Tax=unclassified Tolypothrix TaxID=2649714 RepID=UPI0005EAAFB9|nr:MULTISPECIES: xanthine dehydrogenase family protein subunit M [unclassified Tolypothrix]BAY91401.1 molybdopterin dehydrogenase FAD-binding protein [Microchaete diplosiphon NIES-3275]EKF04469.1 FAD binding domain in molybdopterin dehydrogenase [Tolypothrix sp. PCC 7601]MBE9080913.1 xanthine dehydrogenase family protein subunit M [Tolypothrix sp. LEGE 11397]UYD25450.1 xanthine dehydrogenase family protein subunit M [Tolypothrix sp. PCC 7712]UYD32306.1 xanthine dehydrogenase family protein sub